MLRPTAVLLLACALAACGGAEPTSFEADSSEADLSGQCHGLRPAHCFCQAMGGEIIGAGKVNVPDLSGQEMFTYVIPGRCYNQQADWVAYKTGGGCWRDCRDAIGVDGHAVDPGLVLAREEAGRKIRAAGACGGYMSAPYFFAVGANKYRSDTAMGIGIGIGGTWVTENGKQVCR